VKQYASDVPGTRSCLLRARITFNRPDRKNSNRSGWLAETLMGTGGERVAVTAARLRKYSLGGGLSNDYNYGVDGKLSNRTPIIIAGEETAAVVYVRGANDKQS
jgi:hypothetical protein